MTQDQLIHFIMIKEELLRISDDFSMNGDIQTYDISKLIYRWDNLGSLHIIETLFHMKSLYEDMIKMYDSLPNELKINKVNDTISN